MRPYLPMALLAGLFAFVGSAPAADEKSAVKVVNPPFNTEADEDHPHVDFGASLYFTVTDKDREDLHVVQRRTSKQAWPAKAEIIGDYIKNKGETRSTFSTVGRYPLYLYFAVKDKEGKNFDLYVAVKHDANKIWAAPTPVINVNTAEDECFPWIVATGRTQAMYFSRKTKDGWKLFVSHRTNLTGPQGWGEAEEVGFEAGFHHATVTPDGKTMVLQGPVEKGRNGLYTAKWDGKAWSKPEPLAALNHAEGKRGDSSPNLSRDGILLYFVSDRPGGKGGMDIYVARMADLKKK